MSFELRYFVLLGNVITMFPDLFLFYSLCMPRPLVTDALYSFPIVRYLISAYGRYLVHIRTIGRIPKSFTPPHRAIYTRSI